MALTGLWLWLGVTGMAAGTLAAVAALATEERHRRYYAVLALITGIAAAAYAAMALGIGRIDAPRGTLFLPRYVDWLLTTPLLVLYLGLLVDPGRRVYAALIGSDVLVIGFGVAAGLLPAPLKWVAYGMGSVAYLGLLYLLLSVLPRGIRGRPDRVVAVFTKLRNLTVVLWSLYPAVWLLGPLALGLLDGATEVAVVTYLDLISKVGFVAMALNGRDALDDLDAPGGTAPAD